MFNFDLSTTGMILLGVCILVMCVFEFVNGFHDTANAVATVIYTGTLQPVQAVVWSGIWNFVGVLTSTYIFGLGVAMGMSSLLPIDSLVANGLNYSIAMILAALLSAIIWNLGTWYYGIPCSSSHTLVGSLLGVGIIFSMMPENDGQVGVNWSKAADIGESLLISPLFGFSLAITLMFMLRSIIKEKQIFKVPEPGTKPPLYIRVILITTCTLVSVFHGSNDGQKGVGMLLIILIAFLPTQFALGPNFDAAKANDALATIQASLPSKDSPQSQVFKELPKVAETIDLLKQDISANDKTNVKQQVAIRKRIQLLSKSLDALLKEPNVLPDEQNRNVIKAQVHLLKSYTEYVPYWVFILISCSLGLGTMIGWKRIVVTIGEKIGKRHMTFAEGMTAEIVAASTIGMASGLGLPVSTTHVLSSGVAGSMVASKGVKNLQRSTIANIALAWVLTLPVTIVLSGSLFLLFRMFVH